MSSYGIYCFIAFLFFIEAKEGQSGQKKGFSKITLTPKCGLNTDGLEQAKIFQGTLRYCFRTL